MADKFIAALVAQIDPKADVIILPGDLFDASNGESTQRQVGDALRAVAAKTDKPIIYVPGNHCLRGAGENAWSNFGALPSNVYAPLQDPTHPVILPYKD